MITNRKMGGYLDNLKKGFTLIELLAVIVILAIIALIATPIILNMINDAKKSAAKASSLAFIEAVENYVVFAKMNSNGFLSDYDNSKIPYGVNCTSEENNCSEFLEVLKTKMKGKFPEDYEFKIDENGSVVIGSTFVYDSIEVAYEKDDVKITGIVSPTEKQHIEPGYKYYLKFANLESNEIFEVSSKDGNQPKVEKGYIKLEGETLIQTKDNYSLGKDSENNAFTMAIKVRNISNYKPNGASVGFIVSNGSANCGLGGLYVGFLTAYSGGKPYYLGVNTGVGDSLIYESRSDSIYEQDDVWKTIVMRYDGTKSKLAYFKDGEKIAELDSTINPKDTKLYIGGISNSGSGACGLNVTYANGDYSSLIIYEKALTDAQIASLKIK